MLWLVSVEGDLSAIFPTQEMALASIELSFKHMERIHTYDPNDREDMSIWFRNGDDILKIRVESVHLEAHAINYLLIGYDPTEE